MSNNPADRFAIKNTEIRQQVISMISEASPDFFSAHRIHLDHRLVEDLKYRSGDFEWLDSLVREDLVSNPRPPSSRGISTVRGVCEWVESNMNPR